MEIAIAETPRENPGAGGRCRFDVRIVTKMCGGLPKKLNFVEREAAPGAFAAATGT
jgi:hypothetical protein